MEKKNNTERLKLVITRGIAVLPSTTNEIAVGRPKSIATIVDLKIGDKVIVASQLDPEKDDPSLTEIYEVGTICKVKRIDIADKNDYTLYLKGIKRVNLVDPNYAEDTGYTCEYKEFKTKTGDEQRNTDLMKYILDIISMDSNGTKDKEIGDLYKYVSEHGNDYDLVADFLVNTLPFGESSDFPYHRLQDFLEAESITDRLEMVFGFLVEYFDNDDSIKNSLDSEINKKINENMSRQQKEYYLREKLRIVKEELGEISNREDDADKIRQRVKNNPYPTYIKEKVLSEISKYEAALNSNESSITKTYIEWLLDLPWWQESTDNNDIKNVESILNKNHYGIEKVKERIVEFLALRTKNPQSRSPIICLVGPPGVGKTSLAKSIAEALNKQYVKVSLGGVKDEAEIRGHRKTYIGAMPGRIIKGMKKAGVVNPLFLLDELDKMASDQKGDPASAMLEVLDPEQNVRFSDNYIEEDYDLSKVLFIATANYYNQIPAALIDRLEVIELSSYTLPEKVEIAKQHLIPEVMKQTLVPTKDLTWDDSALEFIINHYTYEAGVRELERKIQKVMRKYVIEELKGVDLPKTIDVEQIKKYLGRIIFDINIKDEKQIPGVVNGMAYTSAGGDLLPIECTYSEGKGKVTITGNLEKTMSESVSVALGYVKSNLKLFGIENVNFNEIDIHVHVPAGGIPKDGPSAGVAITSAIISKLSNRSVKTNISMTGEITLRGKVGIIGGVKEKIISAHRAGVREIFIPIEDERFLEDIPSYVLNDIKIHLVKQYTDIYSEIFN